MCTDNDKTNEVAKAQDTEKPQETATTDQKNADYSSSSWLWILVPILIILFLLSSFMLGTLLYNYGTVDQYAIQLGNGTMGELELFKIVYDNDKGEIVVEGLTGSDVVAPGTEVHSTIRLENPTNMNLDFFLTSEAGYYNEYPVPVQVRLTDADGNYIVGSEDTWVNITELNALEYQGQLEKEAVTSFGFSWRWVYETGREEDDLYDTFLGNLVGVKTPGVYVAFYVNAETSPSLASRHFHLHKNFYCCFCCYLVWILLFVSMTLYLYNKKYRRKLRRAIRDLKRYEKLYGPLPDPYTGSLPKETQQTHEPAAEPDTSDS